MMPLAIVARGCGINRLDAAIKHSKMQVPGSIHVENAVTARGLAELTVAKTHQDTTLGGGGLEP